MIHIWTDGSAIGSGRGKAGWSAILIASDGRGRIMGGYFPDATNNQMETEAVTQALRVLKNKSEDVVIHTDSQYVIFGVEKIKKRSCQKQMLSFGLHYPMLLEVTKSRLKKR